jgi:ATP-dependent Lon protease
MLPDPTPGTVLTLPLLPLRNAVLLPFTFIPVTVGKTGSQAAVEAALLTEEKTFLMFAQRSPGVEQPGVNDLYTMGTRAVIKKMARSDDGIEMLVQGVERVVLLDLEQTEPYLKARVRPLPLPEDGDTEVEALHRSVIELAGRILSHAQPQAQINVQQLVAQAGDPLRLAYLFASMLGLDVAKEQAILEAPTRAEALRLLHSYMTHELRVLEVRQQIVSRAQSDIGKEQRDYLLRRQMQAIQEELGDQNPEKAEAAALRQRLKETDLPDEVRKEAERELTRLERMPPAAPDSQLIRAYLELILELPWKRSTTDNIDLERARHVLDTDHFDLDEVKQRILEHLAVLKLNPEARAPILCLVGPPGTGKTSLGQSIARAMGRKFERASLGGLHDEPCRAASFRRFAAPVSAIRC